MLHFNFRIINCGQFDIIDRTKSINLSCNSLELVDYIEIEKELYNRKEKKEGRNMNISLTSDKLESVLEEIQKNAKTRTITLTEIKKAIEEVEKNLNCTKKSLNGSKVCVDINAQEFPNAYKCTPVSTIFCATYKNNKWYITDIYRGTCTNKKYRINLSDEAKKNILQNIATGRF